MILSNLNFINITIILIMIKLIIDDFKYLYISYINLFILFILFIYSGYLNYNNFILIFILLFLVYRITYQLGKGDVILIPIISMYFHEIDHIFLLMIISCVTLMIQYYIKREKYLPFGAHILSIFMLIYIYNLL